MAYILVIDDDPAILNVDIFMPEMDELETIKVHRLRPGLPVVVISGYQFGAAAVRSVKARMAG